MEPPPARLDGMELPDALLHLRDISESQPRDGLLLQWARDQLGLSGQAVDDWYRRAWWGLVAGELVRRRLADRRQCAEVLDYIARPDWSRFLDAYERTRAAVFAAAHAGPPKAVMHVMSRFSAPTMIWTNKTDLPEWVVAGSDATFHDPTSTLERRTILPRAAIHLRQGGVLAGAPDFATGGRTSSRGYAGLTWSFSFGIPALARRLGVPVFLLVCIWDDCRLRLVCEEIAPPPAGLAEEEWYPAWIDVYWQKLEPYLRGAPENVRALRFMHGKRIDKKLRGLTA